MNYIKRLLVAFLFVSTFCSCKNKLDNSSDLFSSIADESSSIEETNENSSSLFSSSDESSTVEENDENSSVFGPFIVAVFCQNFYIDGIHYSAESGLTTALTDDNVLIGYFINEEDLEKWIAYDNNPELIYAIDEHNSLYRLENGIEKSRLENRFELYSINDSDDIGMYYSGNLYIYEKIN